MFTLYCFIQNFFGTIRTFFHLITPYIIAPPIKISTKIKHGIGNGKRHRTPTPLRLRKIKVVSFKAFFCLKELFKNFNRRASNSLRRRAPAVNDLKTRIHLTRGIVRKNETAIAIPAYEPTQMSNAYNSSFWQWRRVAEWYRYINDPYENIRGT